MIQIISFIWQLPQNILGIILRCFYQGVDFKFEKAIVRRSSKFRGGISLGRYVIIGETSDSNTVKHEWGHCRQSIRLGWLYLLIVGLPSLVWATLYGWIIRPTKNGYLKFYTESWADKLGNVTRE